MFFIVVIEYVFITYRLYWVQSLPRGGCRQGWGAGGVQVGCILKKTDPSP
jgi:hypothetical protein